MFASSKSFGHTSTEICPLSYHNREFKPWYYKAAGHTLTPGLMV
jgi:hypothetical protein